MLTAAPIPGKGFLFVAKSRPEKKNSNPKKLVTTKNSNLIALRSNLRSACVVRRVAQKTPTLANTRYVDILSLLIFARFLQTFALAQLARWTIGRECLKMAIRQQECKGNLALSRVLPNSILVGSGWNKTK